VETTLLEKLVWKADGKHLEGRRLHNSQEVKIVFHKWLRTHNPEFHRKENNLTPTWEN
jgi:hypothetical protein